MLTESNIKQLNSRFEQSAPDAILAWSVEKFGNDLALSTGFGASGIVLMHQLSLIDRDALIFYLDTDLLFRETYELIDRLEARLGINLIKVKTPVTLEEQAKQQGEKLWESRPDLCCHIRKVLPLQAYLKDKKAWVTGIRRDQSETRKNTQIFTQDDSLDVLKINPLATWTEDEVWTYIRINELPYNVLHDKGYPSIGCWPCTKAVENGDDLRAGRWSGTQKTECGIHKP